MMDLFLVRDLELIGGLVGVLAVVLVFLWATRADPKRGSGAPRS